MSIKNKIPKLEHDSLQLDRTIMFPKFREFVRSFKNSETFGPEDFFNNLGLLESLCESFGFKIKQLTETSIGVYRD